MSNTTSAPGTSSDTRKRILAIVSSASGNLVEWYDFYVYSFCTLYFASQFFPSGNRTTELLAAAAVQLVTFFMRPVGGWVFGRFADRYGRRSSMLFSIVLMCGSSFAIAVLPTYAAIGIAAPILMTVIRLLQGFSVGGEYGAVATYMSEVALKGRRGFFASFQYVTLIGGQLLAVLVLSVLQRFLDAAEMSDWGWRVPFAIGGLAAIVSFYLRRSLHETSTSETRSHRHAGSLKGLFGHYWRPVLVVMGFTAGGSLSFYAFTTYMQKYLVNTAGMPTETATDTMLAVLFVYMLLQPVFGWISDKIGRRNSMLLFGGLMAFATVPLYRALGVVASPFDAFVLATCGLAIISFYTSISGLVKAELFPAQVRTLGVGLSYAIANALFGGSAEAVALQLKNWGHEGWFAWYVATMCAISFAVALIMPDARKTGYLQGESTVD